MSSRGVSLEDKYRAETGQILLSGIEALVRLPMEQIRLDRQAGLNTAGFISGYRGSPLGGYDQRLTKAEALLGEHDVRFQPGLNEDLAATAVWGTQQVNLHPGAKAEGVFGIWYGKAPGVDRSGDVFKHANMTGTWPKGGVLAIAGDDPLAKSSSLPSQSEFAFVDAEMPVLTPADLQDVLDLGLHGLAMSRYAGLWSGMIALADLMDGSATVTVDLERLALRLPPDDGEPRHITLASLQIPNRLALEETLRRRRLPAALRYARANALNKVIVDSDAPRLGLAVSGKCWSATLSALDLLGISLRDADRLGLRLLKVSMPWPLEPTGVEDFASGVERIVVIEGKRSLIETQIKDQLYNLSADRRPAIVGKTDPSGAPLLPTVGDPDALTIAAALLSLLPKNDQTAAMAAALGKAERMQEEHRGLATASARPPHFCSGCPHSRSTRVPEGSRAMAGIGCHIMTQWMGGEAAGRGPAESYSQMGGEGVAWLGQAPFSGTGHVFANLGDGTYYHSGLLAIRAAVAADVSITYKILYNDAVAMTGGQPVDGPLSVEQIVAQLRAEGVQRIVVLSERPERFPAGTLPDDVSLFDRSALNDVQKDLRGVRGVSVLIFDQTCAAEKRRRRKRGLAEPAKQQVLINERVCEGCGDCSRQSNCLSVEPVETAFGTKRRINQSSCNQDLSCTDGFCPSFVMIEGGEPQKRQAPLGPILNAAATLSVPGLPASCPVTNVLMTGIGGTGVTTLSAILAMAAHLDGRRVLSTDVTGLAQKGGAVLSYLRFGPADQAIHGAKMQPGSADLVIGCDLLVAAGVECLTLCSTERSTIVADRTIAPTGRFALFQEMAEPLADLATRLRQVAGHVDILEAGDAADRLFGDRIFANMILAGAAFQRGKLPLSLGSIEQAIALNAVSSERNRAAFHAGRVLAAAPELLEIEDGKATTAHDEEDLDTLIARLSDELIAYQDEALAARYRSVVGRVRLVDRCVGEGRSVLSETVARSLFKLMAYKDEYEVARLHSDPVFRQRVRDEFGDTARLSLKLAPPLLARTDRATGRPRKMAFGPWIFPVLAVLARLRRLRGTAFDPFGWTVERRMERRLVEDYIRLIERILPSLSRDNYQTAVELAAFPQAISGFGPIKKEKAAQAEIRKDALLTAFERTSAIDPHGMGEPWQIAAE
ncbi:MAG: indolepyruvate ferredoxin oxidoreductase family protein [Alphaproteobacteria bacterium]